MRSLFVVLALVLFVPRAHAGAEAAPRTHAGAEADIRASFDRYRKAALAGDGNGAARELDDNTVRTYAALRTAALTATDIHGLPLADKLEVVRMRHVLDLERLSAVDGRALAGRAIVDRWIEGPPLDRSRIGSIHVNGAQADVTLLVAGKPAKAGLVYRKSADGWRLDLSALRGGQLPALTASREKSGLSDDDYVLQAVRLATGRVVPVSAWRPLVTPRPR